MPFDPTARRRVGRTALTVTRLGFGGAPIGGLFTAVTDADAIATVRRAWDLGVRYFDTAPLYGYGASERRIGAALAGRAARRVHDLDQGRPARPADRTAPARRATSTARSWTVARTRSTPTRRRRRVVFDYSYDGVMRSIEESLERLGLERVDIAFIHDPDDHWKAAIDGRLPRARPAPPRRRRAGDRRGDEPVGDARPVRARGRLRRLPARGSLHAPRPGGAGATCCRCARRRRSGSSSAA